MVYLNEGSTSEGRQDVKEEETQWACFFQVKNKDLSSSIIKTTESGVLIPPHLSSCISLKVLDLLLLPKVICSICSRSSFFFTMSELTLLRRFFHLLRSWSQSKLKSPGASFRADSKF